MTETLLYTLALPSFHQRSMLVMMEKNHKMKFLLAFQYWPHIIQQAGALGLWGLISTRLCTPYAPVQEHTLSSRHSENYARMRHV